MRWIALASFIGLVGDVFVRQSLTMCSLRFILAVLLYAATTPFWFHAFKTVTFSESVMLYPAIQSLVGCLMGCLLFGDVFTVKKGIGLLLGLVSIHFIGSK